MSEFITNLSSLYWWISVVIVGILINLFSSYVQKVLERRINRTSEWWRKISLERQSEYNRKVDRLRKDPNYKFIVQGRMTAAFFLSIMCLVLAVGVVIVMMIPVNEQEINNYRIVSSILTIVFYGLFAVMTFLSFLTMRIGMANRELLEDAFMSDDVEGSLR